MNRRDQIGNPLVRVQMIEESGSPPRFQVIDKRNTSDKRVIAEYDQQSLAEAHAEMLWRTP